MSAASAVTSQCREILSKPTDTKLDAYSALAGDLVHNKDTAGLISLTEHLVTCEGADQYNRTYIVPPSLTRALTLLLDPHNTIEDPIDLEDLIPLTQRIVEFIRPRAENYPYQLMLSIELLAKAHQGMGEYRQAAYTLQSFRFEDYAKKNDSDGDSDSWMSVTKRFDWYLTTAELWLAVEDTGPASQAIKKAHALLSEIPKADNGKLLLRFRTVYARVLDNERKFLEASQRYFELSQSAVGLVSEEDVRQTLQLSVNCALLAKPSPSRSRILAALYSDDRVKSLPSYTMLEAMFYDRLIRPNEVKKFEALLSAHQIADTSTGLTVLQNSIIEHNISAISKIYKNIFLRELALILGIREADCESVSAGMIEQGRLSAVIDQVTQSIEFTHIATATTTATATAAITNKHAQSKPSGSDVSDESLHGWDRQIEEVCLQINRITDSIQRSFPQLVPTG